MKWGASVKAVINSNWQTGAWLQLFGHLARRPDEEEHHRVLVTAMSNPTTGWRRPRGRPRETWLRTVSRDVQRFNIRIHSLGIVLQIVSSGMNWSTPLSSSIWVRHQGRGQTDTDSLFTTHYGGHPLLSADGYVRTSAYLLLIVTYLYNW